MKLTHIPIEEIIVSNIDKTTLPNITKEMAISSASLDWCNGFVFSISVFPYEKIALKQQEGIWLIDSIVYADCPEKIEVSKNNGWAVDVLDRSGFAVYEKLTELLKERKE